MKNAQEKLEDLASGKLKKSEAWGVFTAFADEIKEIYKASEGVVEKGKAFKGSLDF
jgi:hypothetical protein